MDGVTQQNAALVEEAAAAAESLVDQAVGLMDVVSAFQLNRSASISAPKSASKNTVRLVSSSPMARLAPNKMVASAGKANEDWAEF